MTLLLLPLFCNHDNLVPKLYQNLATLMKSAFLKGDSKLPEMINNEELAQFIYRRA